MISDRRKFIKTSLLGGAGITILNPGLQASFPLKKWNLTLGVCADLSKSVFLKSLGYDFIEPSVGDKIISQRFQKYAFTKIFGI
jgi:hypothetical protein